MLPPKEKSAGWQRFDSANSSSLQIVHLDRRILQEEDRPCAMLLGIKPQHRTEYPHPPAHRPKLGYDATTAASQAISRRTVDNQRRRVGGGPQACLKRNNQDTVHRPQLRQRISYAQAQMKIRPPGHTVFMSLIMGASLSVLRSNSKECRPMASLIAGQISPLLVVISSMGWQPSPG